MTTSRLFEVANVEQNKTSPAYTLTENGALTLATSGSDVLDLFARGGAMRNSTEAEITRVFSKAYTENKVLAVAILFYLRDVLHGQGERRVFRTILKWLADKNAKLVSVLLPVIPEYGRWDDLFALRGVNNRGENLYGKALRQIGTQLMADAALVRSEGDNASISLAAKWAPSEKAGKASRPLAFELMKSMGLTARQYRKLLSFLRKHLNVVERQMCAKAFDQIRYESVPSRAAMLYRKAFSRNDRTRYSQYLDAVKAGTKEIKAATLYPYDIVYRLRIEHSGRGTDATLELQWKALPNYVGEVHHNRLAVVDGSGSMYSNYLSAASGVIPIDVAMSLGIYLAERNTGVFKDKLITFSSNPRFIDLTGKKTLKSKIDHVQQYNEVANTNLQAVFDMILELAQRYHLTQDEMPDMLYIISDMEFDSCVMMDGYRHTTRKELNLEAINRKYREAGYERPKLIFWNVNSRNAQSPAAYDENGVALFSGCSPTVFKTALDGELNPIKAMLAAIDTERYQPIMELVAGI